MKIFDLSIPILRIGSGETTNTVVKGLKPSEIVKKRSMSDVKVTISYSPIAYYKRLLKIYNKLNEFLIQPHLYTRDTVLLQLVEWKTSLKEGQESSYYELLDRDLKNLINGWIKYPTLNNRFLKDIINYELN
jgi:hypothetical protein